MIRVPVELKSSSIHGTGVFAKENIVKNDTVWYFSRIFDRLVPEHLWARGSDQEKAKLFERGYRSDEYDGIFLCGDEAQFLNFPPESEESNLVLGSVINEQPVLQARRDISAGEELTVPPESDADYERKTGRTAPEPEKTELPSAGEIEETSGDVPPPERLPGGIRDGEDVV